MIRSLLSMCTFALVLAAGCGGRAGEASRGTQEEPSLSHGTIVTQEAVNTGIEGKVMATTADPVPNSVRLRREPLQGAELAIFRAGESQEAARVFSDSLGEFSIELPPGSYVLVPRSKEVGSDLVVAPSQTIPLLPGRISRVSVEYESVSLQPRF